MAEAIDTTRRGAFKALTAFSLLGTAVAVTTPIVQSPLERMEYHLAEFKKAVAEIDPSITAWVGGNPAHSHPDQKVAIVLTGLRHG